VSKEQDSEDLLREVVAALTHDDLPQAAWELLFRITFERLQQCSPRWAEITAVEANLIYITWNACGFAHRPQKAERWLCELENFLAHRKLPKRGRIASGPPFEMLLHDYQKLHSGLQAIRKARKEQKPRDVEAFYKTELMIQLRRLGNAWRFRGKYPGRTAYVEALSRGVAKNDITAQMVADARFEKPSWAACLILGTLWGRSPKVLEAAFTRARRSKNPLYQFLRKDSSPSLVR